MADITIDKLNKNTELIVTVGVSNEFHLRIKLALMLIKLATMIMGCSLIVKKEEIHEHN
jgi:hypothetical protein